MARNQVLLSIGSSWTEITNGDVSQVKFQVQSEAAYIAYTVGSTTPTVDGVLYTAPYGENGYLIDLSALTGANRIWAKSATGTNANILIDHA